MTTVVILAAGKSTRLSDKQFRVPTGHERNLLAQALRFGAGLASSPTNRLLVVARPEFASAMRFVAGFYDAHVIVAADPPTSLHSAGAARPELVDHEPVLFLDSDAVYDDVVPSLEPLAFSTALLALGVAEAPYDTSELSYVGFDGARAVLGQKTAVRAGDPVGAGVYGFASARAFDIAVRRTRAAQGPGANLGDCFIGCPAAPLILKNWSPYGTEEQRARYEASRVHARPTLDLSSP